VPVCEPLLSAGGRWIERLEREGRIWLATAVAKVPGRCVETLGPDAVVWRAWGRSLGALHAAAAAYAPGPRRFLGWDEIWERVGARLPPGAAAARGAFAELDAWQRALPRAAADRGLTHADLRAGNAVADGSRVWLIDFDEPVHTWWAADLARPLLEGALGAAEETRRLRDAFVAGYRELRPLDERWVGELGGFARAKALETWSWILTRWHGDRVPGGEDRRAALARLRTTFLAPLRW
jgi:Ser/Thr protein kinase RdoA (MazF antagonist)